MRREHIQPINIVDTGISVYDRRDVESIGSDEECVRIIEEAIKIFDLNNKSKKRDIFNIHPKNRHRRLDPLELVLQPGVDPHMPILQLARPVIDIYGHFAASVDASKASLSNRTTDLAIEEIQDLTRIRSVGFAFLVLRHEDLCHPNVRGLVEIMDELDQFEVPIEASDDDLRAPRIERLRDEMVQLTVPTMTIVTMSVSESASSSQDKQQMDSGPGLATLG